VCYIGTSIWYDNPGADDNLFVLWWGKYTKEPALHTCPATTDKIRTPQRIDKVRVPNKGIRFNIYTDGEIRNDFEFHAQLVRELVQDPIGGWVQVNGFGTSYEYSGWITRTHKIRDENGNIRKEIPIVRTPIDWYPFKKKFGREYPGEPMKTKNIKYPARTRLMKDADEGKGAMGNVVGAPEGMATNNIPEPWDNHGAKLSNVLYADGHVQSLGRGYWETRAREKNN
ncbi:MAG: hypothetical protein ACYTBZ_25345, partial [Planctomycetota bacterium]|jgi:prepilin-type processing-associated H-X9-DG protein